VRPWGVSPVLRAASRRARPEPVDGVKEARLYGADPMVAPRAVRFPWDGQRRIPVAEKTTLTVTTTTQLDASAELALSQETEALGILSISVGAKQDGGLHANGESALARGGLIHEPRPDEGIIERCSDTGARITPVEGASADALADTDGFSAPPAQVETCCVCGCLNFRGRRP
jgi:hypothetical protein